MPYHTLPKLAVVTTADAFAKTGEILLGQQPKGIEWTYPFIVNVALSIELYLKSYITEDITFPILDHGNGYISHIGFTECPTYGHKFDKLYSEIPKKIRDRIEAEFHISHLAKRFSSLDYALNKFANSFIEARYPYEINGLKCISISDLMDVSVFLKNTIYKLGEFTNQ